MKTYSLLFREFMPSKIITPSLREAVAGIALDFITAPAILPLLRPKSSALASAGSDGQPASFASRLVYFLRFA